MSVVVTISAPTPGTVVVVCSRSRLVEPLMATPSPMAPVDEVTGRTVVVMLITGEDSGLIVVVVVETVSRTALSLHLSSLSLHLPSSASCARAHSTYSTWHSSRRTLAGTACRSY